MTTGVTSRPPARAGGRWFASLPAVAGIVYSLAWIISVSVGAPEPNVNLSGPQVVADFAGHVGSTMTMNVLAEGVAAVALIIVVVSVARAASRCGAPRAGLAAAVFGITAAVMSWVELGLGAWLFGDLVPGGRAGSAGTLNDAINRTDGAKFLVLAAMAVAIAVIAVRTASLPRWLALLGLLLAVSLVVAGLGYILLDNGLAPAVLAAAIFLLPFVTGVGITLRRLPANQIHSDRYDKMVRAAWGR